MKGYKVFRPDFACRNTKFEVGGTYALDCKPVLCKVGYHFCTEIVDCFNYYDFDPDNIVCEVEAIGDITAAEKSCSKRATNKLKIIRQLTWHEVLDISNVGKGNSGYANSGYSNSGSCNNGDFNSSDCNSGDHNSGDFNSGNHNSGNYNSGYSNSGNHNSGRFNNGHHNSGHYNSGDGNSGYRNSGHYNSGNCNSGHFNTTAPTVRMFNRDTGLQHNEINLPLIRLPLTEWVSAADMTNQQKQDNPGYDICGGFLLQRSYKEAWAVVWQELSAAERQELLSLPNFDAAIFKEITGIDTTKE